MKIIQIVTLSELGGAQMVVANIANFLCKDHEIIVIAGEGDDKLFDILDNIIVKIKLNYLTRNISFIKDLISLFQLLKIYYKYKPDIIHLHSSKVGVLGRIVFPSKKVIYTIHGFDSIQIAYKKFLPIEKLLKNRCKAIVGVCFYDKINLLKKGFVKNIYYVYNGIYPPSKDASIRLPNEITEKFNKKILCVARISKQKRFNTFIEIADRLPNYAFIWIGNQINIDKLPANVFCLGNIINASRYNQVADLYLLPSNYEGLPIAIIEAMSYGLPIVASNVGGVSEIVINDVNGFSIENNTDDFVEKIDYILNNKDIYNKYSQNSLKIFQEQLNVDNMVNEYLKLYNL